MSRTKPTLRFVAFHEAGHAVAQHRLGFTCLGSTIEPKGNTLGSASHYDDEFRFATLAPDGFFDIPAAATRSMLTVLYSGYCAQITAGDDRVRARRWASDDFAQAKGRRAGLRKRNTQRECVGAAFAFVRRPKNWKAIELVALELLDHKRLDGDEVEVLIDLADGKTTRAEFEQFRLLKNWPNDAKKRLRKRSGGTPSRAPRRKAAAD